MLRIDLELLDGEPDGRVSIGRLVLAYVVRALAVGDLRIGCGSLLRPATRPNTNFNVRKAPPDAESVPAFRRVNGASLSQTAGGQPQIASPSAPR